MKQLLERYFVLLLALLSVAACNTPDPDQDDGGEELSDAAKITRLSFTPDSNPGIQSTATATIVNGDFWLTVPEACDLKALVPLLQVSTGASATIDGKPYKEGDAYDLSGNVHVIKVTSESGKGEGTYRLCVKTGNYWADQKVYSFMNTFSIPGVSISVMKGTEVVYSSGYGFADVQDDVRVTPDHLFRMASISKQFCTMCIMTLREEGRLRLDQQVFGESGILHGLYRNVTPYHESITVRHLLSHSSGICKGLSDPAFTWSYRMYDNNTPVPTDTLIQRTLNARQNAYDDGSMVWSPGMGYNYSNVGFCILHRIVEVVSGKDYESFLKEDVLSKMGITDTHIGGYLKDRRPNECVFYSQGDGDGYANPLRELAGAAGIITSTNQMMRILTFMDGDDTVPDIFSHETLSEMYTKYNYAGSDRTYGSSYKHYGLGWRLNHNTLFHGAHYHGGNLAGTATLWVGHTDEGMSGAFVCNSRAYNTDSSGSGIDTNMYVILQDLMDLFSNY